MALLGTRKPKFILKTQDEIEKMRVAGRLVHKVLSTCREMCKVGVTTKELDEAAYQVYTDAGAKGLFLNYPNSQQGAPRFPGNTCISVNDEIVHGIPGDRQVKDGDIVSIDCGVNLDGWCGDSATTIMVGNVSKKVLELCETTQHVLQLAIDNIQPGRKWSQVARLMQSYAERGGYGVVRAFVGHGIGRELHEHPQVPNYVDRRDRNWKDFELREGLVMAIEPMCTLGGSGDTNLLSDRWTVKTIDGLPSAHYEHTIAVTADGCDVLTDGS